MDIDPAADRYESGDIEHKRVLVIGCGNVLIGDDGFGTAVIKHLSEKSSIPADVGLVDAGTGIAAGLPHILELAERLGMAFQGELQAVCMEVSDPTVFGETLTAEYAV